MCEQSTDFHFPDLQQQLTTIEEQLPVVRDMSSKKDNSSKDSKVLYQEYFTHKTVQKSINCILCSAQNTISKCYSYIISLNLHIFKTVLYTEYPAKFNGQN